MTRRGTRVGQRMSRRASHFVQGLWIFALAQAGTMPAIETRQAAWPEQPIHIVVAYPPGGVSDAIARALAEKVAVSLDTPVIVENLAGAGGRVALEKLAKAPADGYVLCFSAITPLALAPQLGLAQFDPKDIAPVVSVMSTPVLVVGTSALEATHFWDMLAAARREPGRIRWATSGIATTGHMVLEQVRIASGANITHIPYKGGGQQIVDALSGQFEVLSTNAGAQQIAFVRDGRLKALAVGAPTRLHALPNVPTLAELGFPKANLVSLFGVFAPAKTPEPVLSRLNAEFNRALHDPDLRARLIAVDNTPTGGTAAEFASQIARVSEANHRLVENAHINVR
jgi:tripartite-type tricarboxylate transporter receptor subunit TctC